MNNYLLRAIFCLTTLPMIGNDQDLSHNVIKMQFLYEGLRGYAFQPEIEHDDLLTFIRTWMQLSQDAFGIHSWPISNDIIVRVTILDITLISLSCQEKLLTNILVQCNQATEYEEEYHQYEREKILAAMLRRAGVEQQLTDGEISHYADLMLGGLEIEQLAEICK